MILIPFEYLKKYLSLPPLAPSEIAEKLTYYGLETQLVKKNYLYFEVNPLPNRVDLFCWWGIVQEIKAILNCPKKLFSLATLNQNKKKLLSASIVTQNCSDFSLVLIKNIQIRDGPAWLKEWLVVNQIPSVNNLIDSANLVKLETGQSLRIYDYDTLAKRKEIVVDKAREKEVIKLFSKRELTLDSEDVVVRNGEKIISLAGIVETEKISWAKKTKNVLVESASFNPVSIKKTSQRLNISVSVPSLFFSPIEILQKTIFFLTEIQESSLDSEIIFAYQKSPKKPFLVKFSQHFLEKKVGQALPPHQIEKIWKQLDFSYSKKRKVYSVVVPFHRLDLKTPEDLLEELLRIYDYNRVVGSLS